MRLRDEMRLWQPSTVLMFWGILAFGVVAACLDGGVHLWAWWTGVEGLSWNPFDLALALATGSLRATRGMWVCVGAVASCLPLAILIGVLVSRRLRGRRRRGDEAAHLTGAKRDTGSLGHKEVEAKAKRLGVKANDTDAFGLPVGRAVNDNRRLYSDFEAVSSIIAGPRAGKTTCWVVPRILAAPGLVVGTSNKRDIVDTTRQARARRGQVWVFDPQGIAGERQAFWWNPLRYVTDAVQATAMAQIFMDASRPTGGQSSAYFDAAARDLVAAYLLAAARAGQPLTIIHRWLNDQGDDEPVRILRRCGETMAAETLQGTLNLVPETRSGVFGGASQIMAFMLNDRAMSWVTPNNWLQELDPEKLVRSTDTIYLLSQEGRGSAAPIVTALAVAIMEAAVDYATSQPGGRLSTPALVMLDEAANVCRWAELPNMYSHFGSRGLCVDTVLQSWSQGVVAWGPEGMNKLWSASNVKLYGGSVDEDEFLQRLSSLIGSHWIDSTQFSHSDTGSSSSVTPDSQERRIATVSDLRSMPMHRAWTLASGTPAVLTRLVPFWETTNPTDNEEAAAA